MLKRHSLEGQQRLAGGTDLRLAIVSPFLDRKHGTERCIVEQIERFLTRPGCEIHIYSQSVQDLEVVRAAGFSAPSPVSGKAIWHPVPSIPGPGLLKFVWWYFANRGIRWFHENLRSVRYDVVYSPGINCSDADAIAVHIVFHEYFRLIRDELRLSKAPLRTWPILLHRALYYRLIMALERRIYRDHHVALSAVSNLTAGELTAYFARREVRVILNAVDLTYFTPRARLHRREDSRRKLRLLRDEFIVLLIGNDWRNKGLETLLAAVALTQQKQIRVVVVGHDNQVPFLSQISRLGLERQVVFADPSPDVLQFYAAADVYASPTHHDSFALPPIEAMACGLPVITSDRNGGAQIITDGFDGFVLKGPDAVNDLAQLISRLCVQPELCRQVGDRAAQCVQSYTWDRNASETWEFLRRTAEGKVVLRSK